MAIVVVDQSALLRPALLTPKSMPRGPLAINWNHPITRGLLHCCAGSNRRELVSKNTVPGTEYGLNGYTGVQPAANLSATQLHPLTRTTLTEYTVFGVFLNSGTGGGHRTGLLYGRHYTSSYGPLLTTGNGYNVQCYHGAADFSQRNFTMDGAIAPGIPIPVSFAVDCAADTCVGMRNSLIISTTKGGTAQSTAPYKSNAALRNDQYATMISPIACAWNRILSDAELMLMHRDPFCFLMAA